MEKSEADTARPAVAGEIRVDPETVKEKFTQLREAVYSEFQGQEKIDKPASLAAGKALRKEVPGKAQAEWTVEKGRSRGVDLLKQQESDLAFPFRQVSEPCDSLNLSCLFLLGQFGKRREVGMVFEKEGKALVQRRQENQRNADHGQRQQR